MAPAAPTPTDIGGVGVVHIVLGATGTGRALLTAIRPASPTATPFARPSERTAQWLWEQLVIVRDRVSLRWSPRWVVLTLAGSILSRRACVCSGSRPFRCTASIRGSGRLGPMVPTDPRRTLAGRAGLAFVGLLSVSATLYGALWAYDFGGDGPAPWTLWTDPEAMSALLGFADVVVAVLGIVITVVAILVELAANRYTPRVAELFVVDGVNVAVMGYFVVTTVIVEWVDLSLHGARYPRAMALVAAVLMTGSLLAILPYFVYVFDFLAPTRVILRIQEAGSNRLRAVGRGTLDVDRGRMAVVRAIEQLGDIALNSVDKKDKPLALAALKALERIAAASVRSKGKLPASWFDTSALAREDHDLLALHPDMVRALTDRRTWVEMKVLRQFQSVFGEALNRMRDVNHLIGIHTRALARKALDERDDAAVRLAVRFLNTYTRAAVNAHDVRTAYNLLNEHRLLACDALERDADPLVLEVAGYIRFYGQLAFGANLGFLLETAAFDLGALLETAHRRGSGVHGPLLEVFLDLDREPDGGRSQEASLRGVRKAQIKLATWYLAAGDPAPARRIFEDLRHEQPDRLKSIRTELEGVHEAEYWEVSDREVNFEWLAPAQRAQLDVFYDWFDAPLTLD
jgi:hypothetical protein